MKKSLAIFALAILATAGVHAGVELRTSFAPDQEGVYIVEVVNTETNEVIDVKRFHYDDAGIAQPVDVLPVSCAEETEGVEQAGTTSATNDGGVFDTSDESDVADDGMFSGDVVFDEEEVGAWDAVLVKLGSTKASLSNFYEKFQAFVSEKTGQDSETVQEEVTIEPPLVVPADEGTVTEDLVVEEPEVVK